MSIPTYQALTQWQRLIVDHVSKQAVLGEPNIIWVQTHGTGKTTLARHLFQYHRAEILPRYNYCAHVAALPTLPGICVIDALQVAGNMMEIKQLASGILPDIVPRVFQVLPWVVVLTDEKADAPGVCVFNMPETVGGSLADLLRV